METAMVAPSAEVKVLENYEYLFIYFRTMHIDEHVQQ